MSYLDDDDQVSDLERYLRQVQVNPDIDGAPSLQNYVQPADQQPNYVDPSNNPVQPQQTDPGDLGLMNPPPPKFSVAPLDSFNQDAAPPKIASKPGTGTDQYIKDIGQNVFDHAPIPDLPAFTGSAPGAPSSNLYADQRKYGTPINPRDPQYRMGTRQRIFGTIANALNAFGHGNAPLVYVGPGATNHLYSQDVAAQNANLASTNAQITSAKDLAEENRKQFNTAGQTQERTAFGRRADAQGAAATQNADTNTTKSDNAKKIADDKLAEQKRRNDQLDDWRTNPPAKNLQQAILAYQKETDPDAKASLGRAVDEMSAKYVQMHMKAGKAGPVGGWVNGLTKEENAEVKGKMDLLKKQMSGYNATLGNQMSTPEAVAMARRHLDELTAEGKQIIPDIIGRRAQQPATPWSAKIAPPSRTSVQPPAPAPSKAPTLTPIPDKQMTSPKGNIVRIGDKNPQTGQIVKGFARDSSGAVHATF